MFLHDLIQNLLHSRNMIQQRSEVLAVYAEDINAADCPHPGDTGLVVDESHFSEELTRSQPGEYSDPPVDFFDDLDFATDQTIDPVTDVALSKNDFSSSIAFIKHALGSTSLDLDDVLGQVAIQKPVDFDPGFTLQSRELGPVYGSPEKPGQESGKIGFSEELSHGRMVTQGAGWD